MQGEKKALQEKYNTKEYINMNVPHTGHPEPLYPKP